MASGGYDRKKYSLRQRKLNSGGYDESGQYYGVGKPLYVAENLEDGFVAEFRAKDRSAAIRHMQCLIAEGKLEEKDRGLFSRISRLW